MGLRIYGKWSVRMAAEHYGWLLALVAVAVALLTVYSKAPAEIGLPLPVNERIVPASGVEGFPVAIFCEDPLTRVYFSLSPHAGTTNELERIKDGVTETVTILFAEDGRVMPGTHYYDTTVGQRSEPAIANKAAVDCIEKKREPRSPR